MYDQEEEPAFGWEKPAWATGGIKLKSTGKAEKMKTAGNLAAPITFTPYKVCCYLTATEKLRMNVCFLNDLLYFRVVRNAMQPPFFCFSAVLPNVCWCRAPLLVIQYVLFCCFSNPYKMCNTTSAIILTA